MKYEGTVAQGMKNVSLWLHNFMAQHPFPCVSYMGADPKSLNIQKDNQQFYCFYCAVKEQRRTGQEKRG